MPIDLKWLKRFEWATGSIPRNESHATNHMWEARIKMHKELKKSVLIWGGPCQRKGPVQHRSPAWNSRCLNNAPQQISQIMSGCIRFQPLSRVPAATHPLVGRRAVQVPPCKVGTDCGVSNASNRLGHNIDATTSCTTCKHAKHLLRVQPQKFNAHKTNKTVTICNRVNSCQLIMPGELLKEFGVTVRDPIGLVQALQCCCSVTVVQEPFMITEIC